MKVYIVLCETSFGYNMITNVKKVFSSEKKADQYAEERNEMYHNSYHWVEEMDVDEND